jgi:D-aspartate ligase
VSGQDLLPAVILGGNANAVSVARSLGRRGVEVTAYGNQHGHVRYSRFCTRFVDVGAGPDVADRWLAHLLGRPERAVLLPCDDDALTLIAHHRARLVDAGYVPFEADDEVVLAMLDKARTYRLAAAAGIDVPRMVPITDAADIERAIEEIGFPCALKPLRSHEFGRSYRHRKAFIVRTAAELRWLLAETARRGLAMMAIEIVSGGDDRLCSFYAYIDEHGRPLVGLTKRKIRQYPTLFGLGSYEVTDVAPDVAAAGARFFAAVGVRGLANVEFKRDARDGTLRLIECNHRFTASNELVRAAGVDLAWLAYARLAGAAPPPLDTYRPGVTLWNPLRDLRGIAAAAQRGDLAVGDWLPGLLRRHVLPVFRWDDPAPTIAYHAGLVARIPSKLRGHATAGRAVPVP